MYYGLILLSACMFSVQFLFQQKYEKVCGNSLHAAINYALLANVAGLILTMFMNGTTLEFTVFSGVIALIYAVVNVLSSYVAVKAFETGNLSVFTMFTMLGGMILPFIFGIICGEELKLSMIISFVMIIVALLITVTKDVNYKKALKYYVGIFVLNGMGGVLAAFHQKFDMYNISSTSFLLLTKIIAVVICIFCISLGKNRKVMCSGKILLYSGGGAAINTIANWFVLISLLHLPASIQCTLTTGGVIVFSTLIGFVTKGNKPSKKELLATGIAVASTVVLIL